MYEDECDVEVGEVEPVARGLRQQFVYNFLHKWRNLRAWGRSLDDLNLIVHAREYSKRAGTCWPEQQKVIVYNQSGMRGLVGMLKTGLHEFAHAIETKDGHGPRWQERYAKAVTEVTGHYVGWGWEKFNTVDEHCYRAMLKWWQSNKLESTAIRLGL